MRSTGGSIGLWDSEPPPAQSTSPSSEGRDWGGLVEGVQAAEGDDHLVVLLLTTLAFQVTVGSGGCIALSQRVHGC